MRMLPFTKPRVLAQAGFSLTEVILAVGIVAFTLTALTGLLMVGLNSNRTSSDETRSIYIARQILTDLRSTDGTVTLNDPAKRKIITKLAEPLNVTRPEVRDLVGAKAVFTNVDLTGSATPTLYVAYDDNGEPAGELTLDEFTNGQKPSGAAQNVNILYAAKVEFLAPPGDTGNPAGLKRVRITLESPILSKSASRQKYVYETLLSTL